MRIFLTFLLIISSSAEAADQRGISRQNIAKGEYRAVIIGNNHYSDKKGIWQSLNTPVNDARALAKVLKEKYLFADVRLITNATRDKIIREFHLLSERTKKNDNILIYYAGHGYMEESTKRGYWIPSDASGKNIASFVRNSTIKDEIAVIAKRAIHTLIIADSCFSGSLLSSQRRAANELIKGDGYYQKFSQRKSIQVFTAGGNEFVDDSYADSGHSPFSYFLLNELVLNQQEFISFSEIANNVMKGVANNVKQTPLKGTLYGVGDEFGEFIFKNSTATFAQAMKKEQAKNELKPEFHLQATSKTSNDSNSVNDIENDSSELEQSKHADSDKIHFYPTF